MIAAALTGSYARDHNGHMRNKANVAQMKAKLSEYLRQVKSGGEVVITERGIPVARLVPLESDERRATREERLIRAGLLRPAEGPRKPLGMPTRSAGIGAAVLEALLAERDEAPY
jgi:prevent-host-death family protein